MSDGGPISLARFAEALRDLSIAALRLKVLELRNDITHLDHSNIQLQPYALGTATPLGGTAPAGTPDPDCVEAIRENNAVIERRLEQLRLVQAEVLRRGVSWSLFETKDEEASTQAANAARLAAVAQQAATAEEVTAAARAARAEAALAGAREAAAEAAAAASNGHEAAADDESVLLPPLRGPPRAAASSTAAAGGGNPWTDGTIQTRTLGNVARLMDVMNTGQRDRVLEIIVAETEQAMAEEEAARALTNGHGIHVAEPDDDDGLHL